MAISITDTWAGVDPPFGVELYYSSAWHDVGTDVGEVGFRIARGRRRSDQHAPASTFSCELDNHAGTYSPRNPSSSLYGLIQRNTPLRAWVEAGSTFLDHTDAGYGATTPDSAGLSITGDLELQWYGHRDEWRVSTTGYLVVKWDTGQRSYYLYVDEDGTVHLFWSITGSDAYYRSSTARLPFLRGEAGIKATIDVDNGAGGHDVAFYYSLDDGSTWTQLGDTVTTAGTTSIYDGTAPLKAGYGVGTRVYWVQVLEGIGGTVRAHPSFESQASGTSSFDDAIGNTWTVQAVGELWNRHYRYWGAVSRWPQDWGERGSSTAYAPIEASGTLARIGQASPPLKSCYRRAVTSPTAPLPSVVAYWPLEVEAGTYTYPSALPDRRPMRAKGDPATSSDSSSFPCSDPLPVANDGWAAAGPVRGYADSGEIQVFCFLKVPSGGVSSQTRVLTLLCGGSAGRWEISVDASGNLYLGAYDAEGGSLVASGPIAFAVNGKALRLGLHLAVDGSDVDWTYSTLEFGESTGSYQSGTLSSQTMGRATWVALAPDHGLDGCTVGHVTVQKAVTGIFDQYEDFRARTPEEAATRVLRLAGEESVSISSLTEGSSVTLGYQRSGTLAELLQEAEESDLGFLSEPRTSADLRYVSGIAMTGQSVQLAIDYTGNLLRPFRPVDDVEATRNLITVKREDSGASSTQEDSTGPMGTQAAPTGVGIYESSVALSLGYDSQVTDQATWRLHAGTVDEARWPTIGIDLAHPTIKADSDLTRSILLLDLGDRLTVDDLPSWLPPDTVDQVVQGYSEKVTPSSFKIELSCSPYTVYRVGVWDQDRYCTDGTTLSGAHSDSTTSLSITNSALVQWGHGDGDFDIVVGGEIMTVTAVSGTGTSQTLTVTRSVNGVVKAHSDGAAVDLANPFHYGI